MNPYKIKLFRWFSLHLEHKLNGFSNPFHQLVEGASLGVAAGECGHGCHKEALGIAFHNHVEFTCHWKGLSAFTLLAFVGQCPCHWVAR